MILLLNFFIKGLNFFAQKGWYIPLKTRMKFIVIESYFRMFVVKIVEKSISAAGNMFLCNSSTLVVVRMSTHQ
jgi:hypothetical protein